MAGYFNANSLTPDAPSTFYKGFFDPSIGADLAQTENTIDPITAATMNQERQMIAQELLRQQQESGKNSNLYQSLLNEQLAARRPTWDASAQEDVAKSEAMRRLYGPQVDLQLANIQEQLDPEYRGAVRTGMLSKQRADTAKSQAELMGYDISSDQTPITIGGMTFTGLTNDQRLELAKLLEQLGLKEQLGALQASGRAASMTKPTKFMLNRQYLMSQGFSEADATRMAVGMERQDPYEAAAAGAGRDVQMLEMLTKGTQPQTQRDVPTPQQAPTQQPQSNTNGWSARVK